MATGSSTIQRPQQREPLSELVTNDSYVLVRLHNTQAYFSAGWLAKAGYLIFTSSVESTYQPGVRTQSLHQVATIEKNVPCKLGLSTNLTEWLPARTGDSIRINLKYVVVQDTPLKRLVGDMGKIDLAAKVSLVRPDWAVAVKVSEMVGYMLSYFVGEGGQHEVFNLTMDLNLAQVKTGYYAVIGSHQAVDWPAALAITDQGELRDDKHFELANLSFAVIEVLAIPRLGDEMARERPWWELLQAAKTEALYSSGRSPGEILEQWKKSLRQVRAMIVKDRGFLNREVDELIIQAHHEVEQSLPSQHVSAEAYGSLELPEDWQDLLNVRTNAEIQRYAKNYLASLDRSRKLRVLYDRPKAASQPQAGTQTIK
jgi:hypothetical protein